ncbi:MAG: SDR family oxidoreductase [Acidobacteria bacterium]|nr:SDR family oxidoreductase [Acidobacteriota bacterium]
MNLVVGATGLVGSEICRRVAAQGKPVRALVRSTSDPAKIEKLKNLGIELASGDLRDRASLDTACRGTKAVLSTASSTVSRQAGDSIQSVDLEGQLSLIDAARSAGVEQFVYVSFRDKPGLEFPLQTAKRQVEQHLKQSGLAYAILQASPFMEIWLSPALGFDAANARARIYGTGHNKISWVSFRDVAHFAAASLDNPRARHAVIGVAGPEPLSPLEVVRIFEEVSGKKFTVEHVPEEALRAQKAAAADPMQDTFAGLMLFYSGGDEVDMRATLAAFPTQLTSVRDYARAVLQVK